MTTAVMHGDGVADHDRQDHRRARPGLDDLLLVARVEGLDLLLQGRLDEGPLLYRPAHLFALLLLRLDHEAVRLRVLARLEPHRRLAPGGLPPPTDGRLRP